MLQDSGLLHNSLLPPAINESEVNLELSSLQRFITLLHVLGSKIHSLELLHYKYLNVFAIKKKLKE